MKISLCSFTTPGREAWSVPCHASQRAYAKRHGFDFVLPGEPPAPERPPAWQKPDILLSVLPSVDWAVWLDDDALITNFDFDLPVYLTGWSIRYELLIATDKNGVNNGVMVWRNSPKSSSVLKEWRSLWRGQTDKMSDQESLVSLLFPTGGYFPVLLVPQTLINACPETHDPARSWLCHFAGYGGRAEMVPRWAKRFPIPEELK